MHQQPTHADRPQRADDAAACARPACPVCGAALIEIRTKLVCSACHTICETCCDGGRIA